jgi:SAM-dependent methyltransferase
MVESFPEGYFGAIPGRSDESAAQVEKSLIGGRSHFISFIKNLPSGSALLDAGCGAGKTIRMVQALRPDIHISAVDFTDMRSFLPKGIPFIQGSVEELSALYVAGQFDAIICQHVAEHLLYPHQLVVGMYGVLKPGGMVFIETPNWTRLFVPFSHLWFWNDYTHVRPFSRGAMARLLNESGLSIQRIVTFSSCRWFNHKSARKGAFQPLSSAGPEAYRVHSAFARLAARLINPLLRDTLIAVARKPQ